MKKRIVLFSILALITSSTLAASYFNDPLYKKQWSFMSSSGKRPGSSITQGLMLTKDLPKEEVIVAVIDSGVDYNHVDLKGRIWTNSKEIPGNLIDDDHNGHIDDYYGIDLIDGDSDPYDAYDHGTHVAGIIAAVRNNNIGIAGIATNAKIMAIRAIPNEGDEEDDLVIEALEYAAKNGARIINCSFAKKDSSQRVSDAIARIHRDYDVLIIATAGNEHIDIDHDLRFPGGFENENIITVSSCSKHAALSYFSSYGSESVDIFAPGSIIYSLEPGNGYQSMSGTSQAAPLVAGIAAELLSLKPELTAVELKEIILGSAISSNYMEGKVLTGGRVDFYRALQLAQIL